MALVLLTPGRDVFAQPKPGAPPAYRIGVILPLTGQYAAIGKDAQSAIMLASGEDTRVQFIFEDSAFKAAQALSAYQKLKLAHEIDALINLDSVSFKALHPLLKLDQMFTLQLAESVSHERDTVFQLMPSNYPLFSLLGEVSAKRYRRIALVYGASEFLQLDAVHFRNSVGSGRIVIEQELHSLADYRSIAARVLAEKPEATTFLVNVEDGLKYLRALKELNAFRRMELICDVNTTYYMEQYLAVLGSEIFEGCLATVLPNDRKADFVKRFRKRFGHEPAPFADYAYDAASLIRRLASAPKERWLLDTQHIVWRGVSGVIKFDQSGTRLGKAEIQVFRGGKFVKVKK